MRNLIVDHPDQAWAADITDIPLAGGFGYLFAIIDWFSRYVIAWELSNLLDTGFCIEALEKGLYVGKPGIFLIQIKVFSLRAPNLLGDSKKKG